MAASGFLSFSTTSAVADQTKASRRRRKTAFTVRGRKNKTASIAANDGENTSDATNPNRPKPIISNAAMAFMAISASRENSASSNKAHTDKTAKSRNLYRNPA